VAVNIRSCPFADISNGAAAASFRKYEIPLDSSANQKYIPAIPCPSEGTYRDRHGTLGAGCDGRGSVRCFGAGREHLPRTAKSCGPGAATLASSCVVSPAWRRWQKRPLTGESTKQ